MKKLPTLIYTKVVSEQPRSLRLMAGWRGPIPSTGDNHEQEEAEEIAALSPRTSTVRLLAVENSLGDRHDKFDRMMDNLEALNRREGELPRRRV